MTELQSPATNLWDDLEITAFSDWIHERFGYDFRDYQPKPLRKNISSILCELDLDGIESLKRLLISEPTLFPKVLSRLTVMTSSMFRNPEIFGNLLRDVFPYLRTYSSLKIWSAGCARGEEIYTLAILLKEQGLLERTRLYATDINPAGLEAARKGIYPARRLKEFARNYQAAGGNGHLSDHFEMKYDHAKFSSDLTSRILFSKHDLASDAAFGEMQLILCRNVLIYFNVSLQQRVIELFRGSLCPGGFLCLGQSEALPTPSTKDIFKSFSSGGRIYKAIEG